MKVGFGILVVILSMVMLSACGSAPIVKSSKYYDDGGEKVDAFEFVYYKSKMSNKRRVGASSPSQKSTSGMDDIRYETFGDDLLRVAEEVFSDYGVTLLDAKNSEVELELSSFINGEQEGVSAQSNILYVYASSGKVTTNQHMVRARYVFEVLLLDPVIRKVKWRASIGTSAWAGRDFVMKNAKATVYDQDYAIQLLKTVADKMKSDGVI